VTRWRDVADPVCDHGQVRPGQSRTMWGRERHRRSREPGAICGTSSSAASALRWIGVEPPGGGAGMQLVMDDDPAAPVLACPTCRGPVDVRSRHLSVHGSAVQVYCSPPCKDAAVLGVVDEDVDTAPPPPRSRRRLMYPFAAGGALLGSLFVHDNRGQPLPLPVVAPPPAIAQPAPPSEPQHAYGPRWPPTEAEWVTMISQDVWIHPLNGPVRRMPIRHSRVFGAERAGDPRPDCNHGHCGVDIGEVWGEPVMAVHGGVVDRVNRGPNEERGGQYVRLAHRDGTVFTQYFHLAAIPRWVVEGRPVVAGQVIGLLGDTGVKNAAAHLHFTLSVKASRNMPEQYIDPEPLIALWPLRIPAGNGLADTVSVQGAPGRVLGAASRRRKRARAAKEARPPIIEAAPADLAAASP
jgi:hypothetical protein